MAEQTLETSTLKTRIVLAAIVSVLATVVTVLSDINLLSDEQVATYANSFIYLIVFGVAGFMGIAAAENAGITPFVFNSPIDVRKKITKVLLYGVAAGVLIGIINTIVFKQSVDSNSLPDWLDNFETTYDTLILSARAAFMEETIFRLFLFSAGAWLFLFIFKRVFKKENSAIFIVAVVLGIICSSLLFGLIHGSGFIYSSIMGAFLCVIFYRGSWESAVIAHFLGNFISFSVVFLNQ